MTKEDKVLWATWMASTDICEYMDGRLFISFSNMTSYELSRIWDEGLRINTEGLECVAYPYKALSDLRIMVLTPDEGTLIEVKWPIPEEQIVAELKRVNFAAPWVSGLEVKSILVAKWGKNWKEG